MATLGETDQTVFEGFKIWVFCGVLELGLWEGKVGMFGSFCWDILGCSWNE